MHENLAGRASPPCTHTSMPTDWMRANHKQPCPVCGLGAPAMAPTQARAWAPASGGQATTLRHIPAGARHLWTKCSLVPWPQLPATTTPKLGRSFSCSHNVSSVPHLAVVASSLPLRNRHSFAVALAREGLDSKACNVLLSIGPATADTVRELQALHPRAPSSPEPCRPLQICHLTPSPSPSTWQKLLENGLLNQLAAVTTLLDPFGRWWCLSRCFTFSGCAKLVAVLKPNGGLRPIAGSSASV